MASVLRIPPAAGPPCPLWNPRKTPLADFSHPNCHHTWGQSWPEAQHRLSLPFHKAPPRQDRLPGSLGTPTLIPWGRGEMGGLLFLKQEAQLVIPGVLRKLHLKPRSHAGLAAGECGRRGLGGEGKERRLGESHDPCWQLPASQLR